MKQRCIPSTPPLENIAQISSHSFWPNQLIVTVFHISNIIDDGFNIISMASVWAVGGADYPSDHHGEV